MTQPHLHENGRDLNVISAHSQTLVARLDKKVVATPADIAPASQPAFSNFLLETPTPGLDWVCETERSQKPSFLLQWQRDTSYGCEH